MLMQIDGTFIFVVISFLIFLFIIKAILFAPITKVLAERENFYAINSKMEAESKEKSHTLLEEKESALQKSRLEAGNIIKETSKAAREQSAEAIKETKKEIQKQIKQNETNLEIEYQNSKKELKKEISGFVSSIVSKVLSENISIETDENEINKYLNI